MWAQLSIKTALPLTLSLINIHVEELDSYREGWKWFMQVQSVKIIV